MVNNRNSRKENSMRNMTCYIITHIMQVLSQFVWRAVFIKYLSVEVLGINDLFSNIISILALTELGISDAINFLLYKPLKKADTEEIKTLMNFYKKCYVTVGTVILVAGFILTPLLPYIIGDMPTKQPIIYLYFILVVMDVAATYFVSYKSAIIISDQNQYIYTFVHFFAKILLYICQIAIIILFRNYLLCLFISIIKTLCENIAISRIADRLYPYLKDKDVIKMSPMQTKEFVKNVKAMFCHKVGNVVINSTDNIIISKFMGVSSVAIYSNYTVVVSWVTTFLSAMLSSATASIGNLVAANDDKKHVEDVFDNIFFANAWLYGFCSCCLFCLLQPFIGLWVGTDFLLNEVTVILIVFIFYITGMRKTVILFKDASGLFWYDRYKPLFECTLNLVVSLLLVKKLGLTGVLIGTICGSLLVSFWYEAYVLFKYMFQKSIVKYLLLQVKNMTIAVLITLLCYYFSSFISNSILGFCLKMMICLTLPNVIYFIIWHKKKEFIYFKSIVLSYRDKLRK